MRCFFKVRISNAPHFSARLAGLILLAGLAVGPQAQAKDLPVAGTVVKIDESAGKITLKHGPIKKLGMDEGMTMVFKAQNPDLLKQVKTGDSVKFDADDVNGQLIVTGIEKTK